jgi:sarcosine oxidase subunit alpha
MSENISITVNGRPRRVRSGLTVAAALAEAEETRFRRSTTGEARGPLCGMGICFECRVTINDRPHCRACLVLCEPEMRVHTDD